MEELFAIFEWLVGGGTAVTSIGSLHSLCLRVYHVEIVDFLSELKGERPAKPDLIHTSC